MFYRIALILFFFGILSGCGISRNEITYTNDVAPLIQRTCTPCHLPGEAAPFTFLTYTDVKRKSKLIHHLVTERIMPPWPADPTYSHFSNEYYLSDEEIKTIIRWMEEGMIPGDTTQLPNALEYRKQQQLPEPDMIIKVPPVKIKGNNTDLFVMMKIPYELPQDTFVKAIEFVAGNRKLVHHVNTHLVQYDPDKKQNVYEGKVYVEQDQENSQGLHKELGLLHDDGSYPALTPSVSNYLPGAQFAFYPEEIGGYKMTRKGAFYLNDFHYGPSPIDATDSSYYRIYFSPKPPVRPVREFQLGTLGIAPVVPELTVPADSIKAFHIKATLPNDISILTIVPHMHLIGKSYLAYAVKPSGDTIPLIRIHRWDFRWQFFYQFKEKLYLPRGTTIFVEGVFDNTSSNPNNPFNPPQIIRDRGWGSMRTTDEMFQFIVTYVEGK